MKHSNNSIFVAVIFLVVSLVLSVICTIMMGSNLNTIQEMAEQDSYVKFQDRMSLDWGADDNEYLLWIAQEKGGTTEDRAFNILVTLNRSVAMGYDIQSLVEFELGKKFPDNFIVDYQSMEAMHMITHERFDNSNGSLQYRN